jgi:DNA invertase Pin-like site-specific DNA recombinase
MAKGNYKVTDEIIEIILMLKGEGKSERNIAKAVKLSQGTVNKIINLRYLPIKDQRMKPVSEHFSWNDYDNSIL